MWPDARTDLAPELETEVQYHMFLQYVFFSQWMKLKEKANAYDIQIMGDVPFYVGVDSVDVWAAKDNFLLDTDGRPIFIAGVPPDYFSATGQRWGNPIYNWEYLKENNYQSGWTGSDTAASCLTLSGSITSGRLTPSGKFRQVVRQLWKASGLRRRDMK